MTQLYASMVVATTATLLAIILLLFRTNFGGRRPVMALTQRWAAAGVRTSAIVLALLTAIAAYSFAHLQAIGLREPSSAWALNVFASAPSVQRTSLLSDASSRDAQALQALRAYADKIDEKSTSTADSSPAPSTVALPDVDTMIAKLLARLEKQPGDVKGWKMLAWSYLNMDRAEEAARAYETALKLEPSDIEIKKGLEAAKSAQTSSVQTPPSDPTHPTTADDVRAAENPSSIETNNMIRGMVDQLASRLESAPNDADGWMRLMRSRITLGEKDAAKAALKKALDTFSRDAAITSSLIATARELGVESN